MEQSISILTTKNELACLAASLRKSSSLDSSSGEARLRTPLIQILRKLDGMPGNGKLQLMLFMKSMEDSTSGTRTS